MKNKITEDFIDSFYYKAMGQNLREQDRKVATDLAKHGEDVDKSLIADKTPIKTEVIESYKLMCGCCTLAGPGRGDCEHAVGLPGISIPGQHDGEDDTKDCYGKPNGWCASCWKSEQIRVLQNALQTSKQKIMELEEKVTALKAPVEKHDVKVFDFTNSELYIYTLTGLIDSRSEITGLKLSSIIASLNDRLIRNNFYVKKLLSFTADELLDVKISNLITERNKLQLALHESFHDIAQLTRKNNAGENVKDFIAVLTKKDLEINEIYRIQMAGISTAAIGYWKLGDKIHPDYLTLALEDVGKLYNKYDTLYKICDKHNLLPEGNEAETEAPFDGTFLQTIKTSPVTKFKKQIVHLKDPTILHNVNHDKHLPKEVSIETALKSQTSFASILATVKNLLVSNKEKAKEELPPAITREYIDGLFDKAKYLSYYLFPGTYHTICCIRLPNNATVIGESVCITNFNEEDGRKYALEEAKQKVWSLEGYALKEKRFLAGLK